MALINYRGLSSQKRQRGIVRWICHVNCVKGWGFINGDDGKEYFLDDSEVISKKSLKEGQRVSFIACRKVSFNNMMGGKPRALRIREVLKRKKKQIFGRSREGFQSSGSSAFDLSGNLASWDDD